MNHGVIGDECLCGDRKNMPSAIEFDLPGKDTASYRVNGYWLKSHMQRILIIHLVQICVTISHVP